MLARTENSDRLDQLEQQIRNSSAPTIELFSDVIAECPRLFALVRSGRAPQLDQSLRAGAWVDAALGTITLGMPTMSIRRLVYDDGEWFCSLTRQRHLPAELDDTVDARHECLPLAILAAFLEARQQAASLRTDPTRSVPHVGRQQEIPVICENFA